MKYLVVSATALEIKPLLTALNSIEPKDGDLLEGAFGKNSIHVLITGVGMMHMAYHLGIALERNDFDHVVLAGIAGAFDKELKLTEVVEVSTQQFADLGYPDKDRFVDVYDMELQDAHSEPYWNGKLLNPGPTGHKHPLLKKVTGVSVNCISSQQNAIDKIVLKYDPDVEVMEGIALHYACLKKKVEYSEIRAISNYVEVRNKYTWKIKESILALNNYLISWLSA